MGTTYLTPQARYNRMRLHQTGSVHQSFDGHVGLLLSQLALLDKQIESRRADLERAEAGHNRSDINRCKTAVKNAEGTWERMFDKLAAAVGGDEAAYVLISAKPLEVGEE